MQIAAILSVHNDSSVVFDTFHSIRTWMSEDIVLLVDGCGWDKLKNVDIPAFKLNGFRHGNNSAPYRNVALGIMKAYEQWPQHDWYCYIEYDCLVGSDSFKKHLEVADQLGVWCLGNDHRQGYVRLPLLEKVFDLDLKNGHYLLGCCVFYSHKFISKLFKLDFFERFLHLTNPFTQGFFPDYDRYDLSEHLYPTLAESLGGKVSQLACFRDKTWSPGAETWYGNYEQYPMRFRPELEPEFFQASLLHPLKDFDHPLRQHYREKRRDAQFNRLNT